jgi:hypothetical protein
VADVTPPPFFGPFVVSTHCVSYRFVFEEFVLKIIDNMQILTHENILLLCSLHWVKTPYVSSGLSQNCKFDSLAIAIANTTPIQIMGQTFKKIKLAHLRISQIIDWFFKVIIDILSFCASPTPPVAE